MKKTYLRTFLAAGCAVALTLDNTSVSSVAYANPSASLGIPSNAQSTSTAATSTSQPPATQNTSDAPIPQWKRLIP